MNGIPSQIMNKIDQATGLYHRLVLVVAPSGAGKTDALREVHRHLGAPLLNVNLELSRRMLDLTVRQRALQASRLVEEILSGSEGEVVLLLGIWQASIRPEILTLYPVCPHRYDTSDHA